MDDVRSAHRVGDGRTRCTSLILPLVADLVAGASMAVTIASTGGGAQTCTAALLGIRWPEGDAPSIPRSSDRLGPAGCCPLDAGIRYNPPGGLRTVEAHGRCREGCCPLRAVQTHPGRCRAHSCRHDGSHPWPGHRSPHALGRILERPVAHVRHGDADRLRSALRRFRAVADK